MPRIDNMFECENYNPRAKNLNKTCLKNFNYGKCILIEDNCNCNHYKQFNGRRFNNGK